MIRSAASLGLGLLLAACGPESHEPEAARPEPQPAASPYVGAAVCSGCHAEAARRWRGSHHDRAMEPATPEHVLGDFAGAELVHFDERFVFRREGDAFRVRAAGADGAVRDHPVAFTFGVEPLQQVLVEGEGGRLQAVGAAWDTRPAAAGGQRWFHLHPDEPIPPGDALHWTGLAGSWQAMCAECHSTNLRKGYDPATGRYETTWSEPDVSCEACHGPGASHVAWVTGGDPEDTSRGLTVDLRSEGAWHFAADAPIAHRVPAADSAAEIETCAPCHARRSAITGETEPGRPFLDGYRPALLDEGLYFADGQIRDEVYVWGSFVQSRMHAAGVRCSDCHDPHALRIEAPDAVCASCHRTEVFASPAHHRHAADSAGASCVACHMPARTYMVVDDRRDHGFRVPRPDLAVALGVPEPCTGCHTERSPAWAADVVAGWRGAAGAPPAHFATTLDAGRRRLPGAATALAALADDAAQAPIVRATALELLGAQLSPALLPSVERGLRDPDALVRLGAVAAAEALPPRERVAALRPLLGDPRRAVRIDAARALAPVPAAAWGRAPRAALGAALAEYREAQQANADRPEARTALGVLSAAFGEPDAARRHYEAALALAPHYVPARVNLADLHREAGRDAEGERVLREGLARAPDAGALHHALGLLLVRGGRAEEARAALARAQDLAPEISRYAYVYGVALHSAGDVAGALRVLGAAHQRHPGDADLLIALATMQRDAGDRAGARESARRLLALRPDDPGARALAAELAR
ncbi:MAG: tetratricopeptide repeat protein [Myxococcota bacterium]|nr:tetratricopeptide repeat protein [Myxococcota bacterium]